MTTGGFSLRTSVLDSLTRTKRPDVPLRVALRNTAAVVLPLGIGMAMGYPGVGIGIAAGALDTMFSDQPGPYRQRLTRLVLAAFAAAAASLVGFLIGAHILPMAVATAACGFFGGLLVVFGADIARVGMTSMLLLVITAATPKDLAGSLIGAALIFSGGLLLALFSVAAWPLQRYRPERQALTGVFRGLAMLARQRGHNDGDAPALTDAMTDLQQTLLGRHHANGRAMEAFRVLLDLAERIRLELFAMGELAGNSTGGMHEMFRADAARVLAAVADALDAAEPPTRAERALATLQATEKALLGGSRVAGGMGAHARALSGQLAAVVRNANWAGSRGEIRAQAAESQLPDSLRSASTLATLRANLTPGSVAFRHAVRCAVVLTVAFAVSRYAELPHGYWLPMTAAIVLRPDFGATLNFGLLRVVGTILGLMLTTLLLRLAPDAPWAHLALMGVLCVIFRYTATAHYGIAVATLTGTVVILLSFEGVDSSSAMADRVLNTVLGSGMALVAYVLWPTWERSRARSAIADMLDAYGNYLASLAGPAAPGERRDARSAARTARTNAQASLDRMRNEPGTPAHLLELAETVFANGNRLARSSMWLESLLDQEGLPPEWPAVGAYVAQAAPALHELATALREKRNPAPIADLRSLQRGLGEALARAPDRDVAEALVQVTDRLTDNIDTLDHILTRKPA
jgi:uncharacterized membrane protein YccC